MRLLPFLFALLLQAPPPAGTPPAEGQPEPWNPENVDQIYDIVAGQAAYIIAGIFIGAWVVVGILYLVEWYRRTRGVLGLIRRYAKAAEPGVPPPPGPLTEEKKK